MELIITILLLIFVATNLNKVIKNKFNFFLVIAIAANVYTYFFQSNKDFINNGFVGLSFFLIVMYITIFKKSGNFYRKLYPNRGRLSIFGFIFLIPHTINFFFRDFPTFNWYGFIAYLIMIPLFITSFINIRKKISLKKWRSLHKLAWISYLLTFIHLLIVSSNVLLYCYIFIPYFILKIFKYIEYKNKKEIKNVYKLFIIAVILISIQIFISPKEEPLPEIELTPVKINFIYNPGSEPDCLSPTVCLKRDKEGPVYNAFDYPNGFSNFLDYTGTRKASFESTKDDFLPGLLFSNGECVQDSIFITYNEFRKTYLSGRFPNIVGLDICVKTVAEEYQYNLIFKTWNSKGTVSFSYTRDDRPVK